MDLEFVRCAHSFDLSFLAFIFTLLDFAEATFFFILRANTALRSLSEH